MREMANHIIAIVLSEKKEQKIEEICYNNGLRARNFVIYLFVCSFIIFFFFADVLSLAQRNAIENHYADVSQSG